MGGFCSRDTFEQITEERGVSWLWRFYWRLVSAASDSRDSSALSSIPVPGTRLSPARIRSSASGRTPPGDPPSTGRGAEKQEAPRLCLCRGLAEVVASVCLLSFRLGQNEPIFPAQLHDGNRRHRLLRQNIAAFAPSLSIYTTLTGHVCPGYWVLFW